ncbi:site-specific integrase [Terribacillus sp. 179-K 1B1 HS]|uniref:phage lytic cycle repressor MrpR family protein n=1 Tax=Terribacillus sp. 179-K 1B1 HS TaxID=3142388 RepID=UPI0039A354F6
MAKLYNYEMKKAFFEHLKQTYNEETVKVYMHSLKRAEEMESFLDKDLSTFTEQQILEVIMAGDHASETAARSALTHLRSYINWAIQNGLTSSNINMADRITTNHLQTAISHNKKFHITEKDLNELENNLINAQDRVVVRLIFEGVFGRQFAELRNLKKGDINEIDNSILLTDLKKEQRKITVSSKCMQTIREALEEDMYAYNNGKSTTSVKEAPLLDNGYIIRHKLAGRNREGSHEPIPSFHIYRIFDVLKIVSKNPYLDPNKVKQSGQLYYGYKHLKNGRELDNDFYDKLSDQFHISKRQNYHKLKKEVNEESINSLYTNIESHPGLG